MAPRLNRSASVRLTSSRAPETDALVFVQSVNCRDVGGSATQQLAGQTAAGVLMEVFGAF
jgi:hypothetical protein